MARAGLRFYQVQAQLTAVCGEWTSSRQARTMIVGAVEPVVAAQEVSHLAWDASSGGYTSRRTIATVTQVINGDDGDTVCVGPVTWVMVDYLPSGAISSQRADTYSDLTKLPGYSNI